MQTLQQKLDQQAQQNLLRKRQIIRPVSCNQVQINQQKTCVDFSSNDYLGLKHHPKIKNDFADAVQKHGFGSGASALVSGYSDAHAETERLFAQWLGVEKTILFTSGYCANLSVLHTLLDRSSTVLADKLCHASLIDGIILSRAQHKRYQHNNLPHLQKLTELYQPNLIITESLFSMEGDITPVSQIITHSGKYQTNLLIDDAHGIGILGKTGKGIHEHFSLSQSTSTCLVAPLGKAFNAMGAIVAGSTEMIDAIVHFARAYRYTTSLPPAICIAIQSSLNIVQQEAWRRERLNHNIQLFIDYATDQGLTLTSSDLTPIKPVFIGDNTQALKTQAFYKLMVFMCRLSEHQRYRKIKPGYASHSTASTQKRKSYS